MANITESITSAKKLKDIWQSLDIDAQRNLRNQLIYELSVSPRTVENWYKGRPMVNECTRKAVARIVKRETGIDTDYRYIC